MKLLTINSKNLYNDKIVLKSWLTTLLIKTKALLKANGEPFSFKYVNYGFVVNVK